MVGLLRGVGLSVLPWFNDPRLDAYAQRMGHPTLIALCRSLRSIIRAGNSAHQRSTVWQERHSYVPALLVLTTTSRRVEQVVAKAEERCRTEAGTTPTHQGLMRIEGLVVAATDAVESPEAAVADPVWTSRGRVEGLRLADLLREPWERWRAEVTERRADVERARQRRHEFLAEAEGLRRTVQALNKRWYGIDTYSEHLQDLDEVDRDALQLLLNETAPMTDLERRAWRFFARRTELDQLATPSATRERVPTSPDELLVANAARATGSLVRRRTGRDRAPAIGST